MWPMWDTVISLCGYAVIGGFIYYITSGICCLIVRGFLYSVEGEGERLSSPSSRSPRRIPSCTRSTTVHATINSVRCCNNEDGCPAIVEKENLLVHLIGCAFNPIICRNGSKNSCISSVIRYSEYIDHLKTNHNIRIFKTRFESCVHFSVKWQHSALEGLIEYPPGIIYCGDKIFILNRSFDEQNFIFSVTFFGGRKEASKYHAKIETVMNNNFACEGLITWNTIPITSIHDDPKNETTTEEYLMKSSGVVQSNRGYDRQCNFKIKIIRKLI